jgi:hypothetical protein
MKYKILTTLGLVLLILITFVWTAPYLFKGEITRLVKARISKDLKAHVSFSDVDISWFRNFPKIAVGLTDLQVTGIGEFETDTLLVAKQFDVACNPADFVSGDSMRIYSVTLSQPHLHARMLKNGHRNWDIMKSEGSSETSQEAPSKPLKLVMQQYAIHNGYINYEDEGRGVTFEIVNLEQEGRGNFNSDLFTLKTMTTAEAVHFNNGGTIPYQLSAKAKIEASVKIDRKTNTFSFNTDRISFNDLKLHADGFFQWINDSSYNMNFRFKTPTTEFKNILSLLSPVYQRDFASVKSTGLAVFNGFVKGKYNIKEAPAYHVNLDVENGFFQYPDLPVPVKNINLSLHVDNPDGLPDHVLVDIRNGHIEINDDSLDFHLLVKNPKSKPYIDMALAGRMDLANISRLMKLEPGTRLSGLLSANLYARGNSTGKEKHPKDPFRAGGQFDLNNFLYVSNDYPGGIVLTQLLMTLSAKNALINELKGAYLSTHFSATGTFNNLFDFAMRNNPLKASISLKADEINLRDWMGAAKDSTGSLTHVHTTFKVPTDIDFTIQAEADKLHYDNLDMQHLSGKLVISDETLQFDQVKADALEGTMVINGHYSTKEGTENPEIALTYDVNGVDVQKTFFAFNTMQKLMPVGKFMSGKFNSHVSFAGQLGPDMMPNLHGLHGEGNILLTGGSLKDFGPLDKLSQSLDIHELKDVSLENVKADFTFESGKVVVNSFQVHTGDIDMEIFGTHSFDQSLEYGINLKVPRNQLGSKGTAFVKNVVTEAADKGIPVRLNDAVNIYVKMTGTINSPEIKTDMNAVVDQSADVLKKEVDDFVNAKLDSAKQQLRHPSSAKKRALVHSGNKSKVNGRTKKVFASEHKKSAHTKKKKSIKHYTTSLRKGKSIASTSGNR